tara:strand:+ start:417 stop:800 length:384 start_codon:yes stop_codon:yes gene_type:complete
MSTLNVTTIQDVSGSNASTAQEIKMGRAKAWVNYNGLDNFPSEPIRSSYNVSSVTENADGKHRITFTTAMPTANYLVIGTCGRGSSTNVTFQLDNAPTITHADVGNQGYNGNHYGRSLNHVAFFHDS